jgi:hypothetical protein
MDTGGVLLMCSSAVLLAALSLVVGDAEQLAITHVRSTHGVRGVARAENKLLPGDSLVLTFDIEGITIDPEGKVLYSMATEVTDSKGKVHFKLKPRDQEAIAALGGSHLPAFAQVDVGLDQPPGNYTVKVTVEDRAAKRTAQFTQDFEVLPPAFGIVRLTTSSDAQGIASTSIFGSGEGLWVNYLLVGFKRDEGTSQAKANVELRVLDDKGKPTLAKPFAGEVGRDAPAKSGFLPVQFLVSLNRPGKFTVELKATDQLGNKTAELSFPLTVLPEH